MSSVERLTLTCDAVNDSGTFSEGDTISGTVTLVLLKEVTVQSLYLKAKGDAHVYWTTGNGDKRTSHSANRRLFKRKKFLVGTENSKDIAVSKGTHSYRYCIRLPQEALPSSFKGAHGQIVYRVEVVLSRSWRLDRTEGKEIIFASRCYPNIAALMSPQVGSVNKEMGLFSKGHVHMDVRFDKGAYFPGEMATIVARITNSSSSVVTPKFSLKQEVMCHASSSHNCDSNTILKMADKCIGSNTQKEVKWAIQIPRDQTLSIRNCGIISVDYYFKVYLDLSFAIDPEVKLPVLLIPQELALSLQSGVGPNPAGATGGPSNSDFPPPVPSMGPYPPPPQSHAPQPAYSNQPPAYAPFAPNGYSAQPPYMAGGYRNPVPSAPYGPFSYSSSTAVLHPPPSAPRYQPPPPAPSAPAINPSPSSSFNMSTPAPAPNPAASAPTMDFDFLSQTDEPPPSYSFLYPSSAPDNSGAE